MKRSVGVFAVLVTALLLCPLASASAQSEPDPDHWGAKYEDMPGQPAHGLALKHMPDFQPGTIDPSLPGQPGHAPIPQPPPGFQMAPVPVVPQDTITQPAPSPVSQNNADVFSAPPERDGADVPQTSQMAFVSDVDAPPVIPPLHSQEYISPPPPPQEAAVQHPAAAPSSVGDVPTSARDMPMLPVGNTDPRLQYKPPPPPPESAYMTLGTRAGIDIGGQYYYDRYMEPDDPSVIEGGGMAGLTAAATTTFGHGYFATADLRYAFGQVDYQGSGTFNGSANDLWEGRLTIGRDWIFPKRADFEAFPTFSISPYIGIGYRYLFNDLRGTTSTGAQGYRRENQLYYLPIGVKPRFPIDLDSRLTSTLEADALLWGQQKTYLGDAGFGDPTIRNWQPFGIGVKADVMYETKWWSIGPFVNFWAMDKSQDKVFLSPSSTCGQPLCVGYEPQNYTFEVGIQAKFHFFGPMLEFN